MYGSGYPEPAPAPPVPHDSASNAVSVPSAATPALTRANADGRLPVARCSSLRSSISFTGAFAAFARRAQISPCWSGPNLLPKPPPMNSVITRTLACGIFSPCAKPSRVPCTACVETHAVRFSPFHSQRQPCVSSEVCVCTCVEYTPSTTCAAALKPAARSPSSSALPRRVLPRSNTAGASGRIACSTVARCGSTSHSTLIRRTASSACCSVNAASAAISSPANITFWPGSMVENAARTPGAFCAAEMSIALHARVRVRRAEDLAVEHAGTRDVVRGTSRGP